MKKYYAFYLLISISACLSAQLPEKKIIFQTQSGEILGLSSADFNNDGIDDYFVRSTDAYYWYEVDASANWTDKYMLNIDFDIESITYLELRDLNDDGFTDIFYYTSEFEFVPGWFENPQTIDGSWLNHNIDVPMNRFIGLFDTDADGDDDMIYENSGSYLYWMENTGGDFATEHSIIDDLPATRSSVVADFDQDGDMDWAGYFYDCCSGYYQNNSNGTFTFSIINTDEYQDCLYAVDENSDGYTDLVFVYYGSVTTSIFNPVTNDFNPGTFWGSFDDFNSLKQSDLDNDGDSDWIFFQSEGGEEFAELNWIENTGDAMLLDNLNMLEDSVPKNETYFEFFDYNDDNYPDLFMDEDNFLSVHLNTFPLTGFSAGLRPDSTFIRIDMMLSFDVDEDGDQDIFAASHDGVLAWLKYDIASDSIYSVHHLQNLEASPYPSSLQNFDLDNDGDQDVIASFQSNLGGVQAAYYLLNNGEGDFSMFEFADISFKKVWLTDADEDGDQDLIVWKYGSNQLELYLNTGDTTALFTDNGSISSGGFWCNFDMADTDNDGDKDFIAMQNGTTAMYEIENTNGASTFAAPVFLKGLSCPNVNAVFADDFDADGDDDILYACSTTGTAYQLKNTDGVFSSIATGNFTNNIFSTPGYMYSKDLNRDNIPDAIMSNQKDTEGTFIKISTGAGTFLPDYISGSNDFGIYTNLDGNEMMDFIGTNDFEFYVEYDMIITAPEYTIIPPTKNYLEENGAADSIGFYFTQIPQTEMTISLHPAPMVDAGAGPGVAVIASFNPDSTSLLPYYFKYQIPDDLVVEDKSTKTITITDSEGWGIYAGSLNSIYTYTIADNDPGLFYAAIASINEGVSNTITFHVNTIPDAPVSLSIQPNEEISAGMGFGEPLLIELPAGIDGLNNQTFTITSENDFIHEETHNSQIPVLFESDDILFNEMLPDTISVTLTDNDNASFSTITPAGYFTEGLDDFNITISVTSAPQSDVQIIADPDDEIDLGAGAGIAVSMNFMAGDIIPGSIIFTGLPEENLIVDGLHYGHIEFTIVTEDEFYDALSIPALTISIEDNDLPSVQHSIPMASYLEGSGEFEISFNLTSIPFADVTVTAVPDMNIDLGEGPGTAVNFDFIADGALPDTKIISGIPVDNMLNDGTHSGYIFYLTNSDDPAFDGVAISGSEIFIEDNDGDGMSLLFASDLVYPEGTMDIPAAIYLFTKPVNNVFIYATPDARLDLGDGPGMPVALIANATYEPGEALEFDISIIDDAIPEGYHDGLINFLISTDDPFYAGYVLEPLIIHIEDNDLGTAIINAQKNKYLIYPAISDGIFTIESNGTTDGIVSIFDATGRLITESHISASGKSAIDISYAANGIYFMRISSGNLCFTKEIELAK